jgi:hypothetical protein
MKNSPIRYIIITLTIIFSFSSISNVRAQDGDEKDFQTWFDFRTAYFIDEKWTYDGDYGIRGFISNEDWRLVYINPSFILQPSAALLYRGGIRFIYTYEKNTSNTFEIRPWQGVRVTWPSTNWMILTHYFRLEERFTIYTEEANNDFALRLRYRITAKTPNLRWKAINQIFYAAVGIEFFGNVGKAVEETFIDRNRLTYILGYIPSDQWRIVFEYIRQATREDTEDGFKFTLRILRLRLRYNINWEDFY